MPGAKVARSHIDVVALEGGHGADERRPSELPGRSRPSSGIDGGLGQTGRNQHAKLNNSSSGRAVVRVS